MGTTLALTIIGCVLGFLLRLRHRVPAADAGAPVPCRIRLVAILYVEIFRRIPFLVVTYLVLFFIQIFALGCLALRHRRDRHLHLFHGLYRRDHPRRLQIRGAPADRGARPP